MGNNPTHTAKQSTKPLEPVIGPQYILTSPVALVIRKEKVSDINGNLIFKVKRKFFTIHDRHILRDSANNPLVTFREKLFTAHDRWYAYSGESTDDKDLLFTVRRSRIFQFKTELDVFLAGNDKEAKCDFRIKGTFSQRTCAVYYKDTKTILARMLVKHSVKNVLLGIDTFALTVYPNVDYAFIISLMLILNAIHQAGNEIADSASKSAFF